MVSTKVILAAAALSAPLVAGHGYMGLPKVTFKNAGGDITAPVTTISASQFTAPAGMSFTTDPTSNTNAFTAWIKTSEFTSLRDLILKKSTAGACGNTQLGDPQPLPAAVEWTHGANEGFTPSHQGPCEVWCDDVMVFHDDNCAKNFPSAPAKLTYDKSKCEGKKQLATYWLALHSPDWQVYIGCAAIQGGSGGGSSGAGGSSSSGGNASPTPSTATPTVTPSTPSAPSTPASTPAPAAGDSYDDCDEEYPEPDCDEEYPEPSDEAAGDADDCDEDLPEPDCEEDLPEPDCEEEYPEPADSEYGGEADVPRSNIGFGTIEKKGGESAPGKVSAKQYN